MKMNLSDRERWVLVVLAVFLVVTGIYWVAGSLTQGYRNLGEKIEVKRGDMVKIAHVRDRYMETHDQLLKIKSKLDKRPENFSVVSFLENLAKKQEIRDKISSLKPKDIPLDDAYYEKMVEVQMDNITLPKLVDFIYLIEHEEHLLKVKRLRIKPRYNDRDLLSVTMQVTTYDKKA